MVDGGLLPMRMGALGVKKGVMGRVFGSRESPARRKRCRNRRPGDAVGGDCLVGAVMDGNGGFHSIPASCI